MEVLSHVAIACRVWGWSGNVSPENLADLMDAVHNIPHLVRNWPGFDVSWLRRSLQRYEQKWRGQGRLALCQIFDDVVAGFEAREGKRSAPLAIEVEQEEDGPGWPRCRPSPE
jgi:hypothetical protein